MEEYVNNGDVRIGYWHFAFLSPGSFVSAEASECAGDQDAFWTYHDLIFEDLAQNKRTLTNEDLKAYASQLGLDQETFDQCLDSGKYKDYVREQTSLARQIGVQSTPAFLINGTPIMGAQPFENFALIIEQKLEQ
jgi:protein-disulfide isomerase